jgi:hypothetical protein
MIDPDIAFIGSTRGKSTLGCRWIWEAVFGYKVGSRAYVFAPHIARRWTGSGEKEGKRVRPPFLLPLVKIVLLLLLCGMKIAVAS